MKNKDDSGDDESDTKFDAKSDAKSDVVVYLFTVMMTEHRSF